MKPRQNCVGLIKAIVAPHAGAWIETFLCKASAIVVRASHPTRVRGLKHDEAQRSFADFMKSHPTRVRGLKPGGGKVHVLAAAVAPHAGAWIETCMASKKATVCFSSHPTRVRGLKLMVYGSSCLAGGVAPHAGAWIETRYSTVATTVLPAVAPHAGAWIETSSKGPGMAFFLRRTPRGCVD